MRDISKVVSTLITLEQFESIAYNMKPFKMLLITPCFWHTCMYIFVCCTQATQRKLT